MSDWIYVHDLDPILFQVGFLRIGWYGLMYAISFLTAYIYLTHASKQPGSPVTTEDVPNLITYLILGVIFGGRLGWVVFYGGSDYLFEPWRILETWKGGMSFHGGLLGVAAALYIYADRRKVPVLKLADFMMLWVPVGLFLGRIGNFINGELYGKPTDGTWGVVFPFDKLQVPRHPSQLYEAVLEGLVLFLVLFFMRGRVKLPGYAPATMLIGYGIARFLVEFVRLPDADMGYFWSFVTMGQILSLPMILAGAIWWALLLKRGKTA